MFSRYLAPIPDIITQNGKWLDHSGFTFSITCAECKLHYEELKKLDVKEVVYYRRNFGPAGNRYYAYCGTACKPCFDRIQWPKQGSVDVLFRGKIN